MSRWWMHGLLSALELFWAGFTYAAASYGALELSWLPQALLLQVAIASLTVLLWRFEGGFRVVAIHLAALALAALVMLGFNELQLLAT